MSGHTRLRSGAAATAMLGVLAWSTGATAQEELKLSHFVPPSHGMHRDFLVPWAKQVEQCAQGEVKITIFPGGTNLGNVTKQQEQLLAGVVDIAHGLSGIPRGRFPRTSIINMPFLVQTADAASRTLWALYEGGDLNPEYDGLKLLALHAHNAGLIHTRDRKVETYEDLQGLRVRTPSPAVSEMLAYLGATPQGLPPGEVYESLQKGVIDGTVFPWDPVHSYKLAEVLKYHLNTRAYTVSFFFAMNQARYDALPENIQECIDAASGEALIARFGTWWDAWDAPGMQDAEDRGNVITDLSDAERERWQEKLSPMISAYLEQLKAEGVEDPEALYQKTQDLAAKHAK